MNAKIENPHICIVSPDFTGPVRNGGVGTACYYQAMNLSDAGYRVTVIFSGRCETESAEYWAQLYSGKYGWEYVDLLDWVDHSLPEVEKVATYPPLGQLRTSRLLLEYMKGRSFDLVYFQDYIGHALYPLQYKRAGLGFHKTKFCVTVHSFRQWILDGMGQFPGNLMEFTAQQAEVEALRLAEHLVAPSRYMADWASGRTGIDRSKFQVVPYCFDKTAGVVDPEGSIGKFGPFNHLVFFGRLETRKGLHLFLDSLKRSETIRSNVNQVTFLGRQASVLGMDSGSKITSDMASVEGVEWSIIDNMNTHEALEWLSNQKNILIVAPSLSDNLPLSIIELYINRLPFITTNVGGIPEIIGDRNAHLMANPTSESLCKLIERTTTEAEMNVFYGDGYSPHEAGKKHIDHVNSLLATEKLPKTPNVRDESEITVSIIIPHFNSLGFLELAIRSLLAQGFDSRFEIIIVDDCSTVEGAWENLCGLVEKFEDKRLRLTRMEKNSGPAASRNHGIRMAEGRYLVFFDADNEALPHMLSSMVTAIESSGLDCMTGFNRVIVQNDRDDPQPLAITATKSIYTPIGPSLELAVFLNGFGDTCSIMHRHVPEAVGGWPEERNSREDWEFFTKVCTHGFGFGVIPEILCLYRNDTGSRRNGRTVQDNYAGQSKIMTHLAAAGANGRDFDLKQLFLFANGLVFPNMSTKLSEPVDWTYKVYQMFASMSSDTLANYLELRNQDLDIRSEEEKTLARARQVLQPLLVKWGQLDRPTRIMLFGAGDHSKVVLGLMPSLADYLVGFIDSSYRGDFVGYPCFAPSMVSEDDVDVIIYSSAAHEKSMHRGLKHLAVDHVLLYS